MTSAVKTRRHQMIGTTVERIRLLEKDKGVTRETLEDIKAVMLELAAHTELFPEEDFVIEKGDKGNFPIYRLAEDDDHRFALYMSTSIGAKDVPGTGQIRQCGGTTVRPGVGVCLMPEDVHSIHPRNERPALILHMYGRALDHLPNRVTFNMAEGTYKVFPASPNIREAR